tara:strand:- start:31227 stop:32621 length:1395 start_codon:yes stop_codon:yes gene_type:complete
MAMTGLGNLAGSGVGGAGDGGVDIFDGTGPSLSNLYKQVYTDLIRLQIQQYDSVLSDTLMGETIEGEVKSFDKYLKHDVSKIKTRARYKELGSTGNEYTSTDSERRLIEPDFYEYAELFDPRDEVGLLRAIAPDGQYLRNIGAIFNQKKDLLILEALSGDVLVQTRTGSGQTVNTTMGYGTATYNAAGTAITKFTGHSVTLNGTDDTVAAKTGYEGFEVGAKLARVVDTDKGQGPTDKSPLLEWTVGTSEDGGTAALAVAGENVPFGGATADTYAESLALIQTELDKVTPMNVEKLIRARQKLDANNALMPGMPYICLMHPNNFYSLMADASDTRFTSIDFNEGKPLFGGEAFVYMGFQFRLSNLLPQAPDIPFFYNYTSLADDPTSETVPPAKAANTAGDAIRYVYFYTPACGIFGMNEGMQIRFDEIPERGYALQMYHSVGMNGIRMDGDCMVRVACVDEGA